MQQCSCFSQTNNCRCFLHSLAFFEDVSLPIFLFSMSSHSYLIFLSKTLCDVPSEHLPNLLSMISLQARGYPPAQPSCLFLSDSSTPKLSCQKTREILSMVQCSLSLSFYEKQTIIAKIQP